MNKSKHAQLNNLIADITCDRQAMSQRAWEKFFREEHPEDWLEEWDDPGTWDDLKAWALGGSEISEYQEFIGRVKKLGKGMHPEMRQIQFRYIMSHFPFEKWQKFRRATTDAEFQEAAKELPSS